MKKFLLPVTAVLAAVVFFASCSMEKRHYRPGYHVEWKNNQHTTATGNEQTSVKTAESTAAAQAFQAPVAVNETPAPAQQATATPAPVETIKAKSSAVNSVVEKKSESNNVSSVKAILKQGHKETSRSLPAGGGSDNTILLVILAILLPPLAVYLYEGSWTKRCTINLILTLLCGLPGVIHALIVVLS